MPNATISHRAEIALLAAHRHIPAIYSFRSFAEVGGLMSYGVNPLVEFQRAALVAGYSSPCNRIMTRRSRPPII
jgi:hypothetical protein